jgi:hypothetical protein
MSMEQYEFIYDEIDKLLHVSFIHNVQHLKWQTNPNIIFKTYNKLQMCIDYTNLNS